MGWITSIASASHTSLTPARVQSEAGAPAAHPAALPPPTALQTPPPSGLQELKDRHRDVMRELLMDVLRALAAPNLDIRKKALDIALDLVDARNIDEVDWN